MTQSPRDKDQRQEYRLTAQETIYLELPTSEQTPPKILVSTSLDMSANGLRVITDVPLPLGTIVRACVQLRNDDYFVLVCEVKWVQPHTHENEHLVGLSLFESEGTDIMRWKEMIAARCSDE